MAKASKKKPAGEHGRADMTEMMDRARIVMNLASGPEQPTRAELAHEFGITPRSVSNLIDFMNEKLHVEVSTQRRPKDGKLGFVVQATDFLKQDMSVAEAVASVLLTQSVLGTPLAADAASTERGISRLTASLGEQVRGKLGHLSGRFAVRLLRAAKRPHGDSFRVILDAILENRAVSMEYESPYKPGKAAAEVGARDGVGAGTAGKARKIETVLVDPYGVFFARRSWYLIGRKRSANEERVYKVARIKRVVLTDIEFTLPRGWTVDRHLENAWEIMPGKGPPVKVVVDLDATVAGNMVETEWHPTQQVTPLAGGGARFTARVSGIEEVLWWVLGIGSHATVVEPAALRDRVRDEVRAMAKKLDAQG
jgi:hypothetical protein